MKVDEGNAGGYFLSVARSLIQDANCDGLIPPGVEVPGADNLAFSDSVTRYRAFLKTALKKSNNVNALWGLVLIDLLKIRKAVSGACY